MENIRVLLADDHEIVRYGLANLIDKCRDIDVVAEAGSGKQAIDLYKSHRPDVAVLDISMPDYDGIETARQILKLDPEAAILMLTMHTGEEYLRKVLEAGINGYIMKNTKADQLVDAIRKVAAGQKVFSDDISHLLTETYVNLNQGGLQEQNSLTERETEVAALIADGNTTQEVAGILGISPRTVESHRGNAMKKIGAKNTAELVRYAVSHNLSSS